MHKYNVIRNSVNGTAYGILANIITMGGAFATKTLLIYKLGVEYVGLDGLFASILTFLNMAELGFGTAIVYKLYKPIAENNVSLVNSLLKYYRHIYRWIGFTILIVGIILTPFLTYIVDFDRVPNNLNVYILYYISLSSTVVSYLLFAYKNALFNAHQRNDLISKIASAIFCIQYALQIGILLFIPNYYLYILVLLFSTVLRNLGIAYLTKKWYPQYKCEGFLSKEVRSDIKHKIEALIYNKIGVTIINGSDNIIISKFLGLVTLGIYVSYYYIFTIVHSFFNVFRDAMTAGIGNRIVTESVETNYQLFKRIFFIYAWATGLCSICLALLYQPFMKLWIGESRTLSFTFSIAMVTYFYFWIIRFVVHMFKNAQGLWWEDRFRPLCEGVVNLLLNILMVKYWGVFGVVISTITAMLCVSVPWETYVLFKIYFKRSMLPYFTTMAKWIALTIFVGGITYFICEQVNFSPFISLILKCLVCIIFPNIVFYICWCRSEYMGYAKSTLLKIIKRKNK